MQICAAALAAGPPGAVPAGGVCKTGGCGVCIAVAMYSKACGLDSLAGARVFAETYGRNNALSGAQVRLGTASAAGRVRSGHFVQSTARPAQPLHIQHHFGVSAYVK